MILDARNINILAIAKRLVIMLVYASYVKFYNTMNCSVMKRDKPKLSKIVIYRKKLFLSELIFVKNKCEI